MDARDREKRLAAERSLELVQSGMTVGLGTGSTAEFVIELLGQAVRRGLDVWCLPTSEKTRLQAEQARIPLLTFSDVTTLNLTIDGADEVDKDLNLVKGGGGALLREKVVASASEQFVVIVDSTKQVAQLGAFPLPVEVVPFAVNFVERRVHSLGAVPLLRRDQRGGVALTDQGNALLDCNFGIIDEPARLARELKMIPGLVEHGLFLDMANQVVIGRGESVEVLVRPG